MTKTKWLIIVLVAISLAAAGVLAQRGSGRRNTGRGPRQRFPQQGYDNRSLAIEPEWEIDQEFTHDLFTFVRIRYASGYGGRGGRGMSGGSWATDYPDSELNFSFRLQQLTSIEVNPIPIVLELTDPELFNYPFIYIVEPGNLIFSEQEKNNLRRYLLNGGFLMIDDFWGRAEWYNIYGQMKRVFPNKEPMELPLSHEIFHCVFELKEKPQIPAINTAIDRYGRLSGLTTERQDAPIPHYYGIYDDKGRMMVIICRDTDLGDGWEREGENQAYFREFSEKKAYPLGINIVFYAMTH
ncbi:MAG: DUF4159 domain-containing protein [Sedimentisphaerales bacterium]|nr:DUF4159 domain-containing protein [Sedimentisphaerales bacterium]